MGGLRSRTRRALSQCACGALFKQKARQIRCSKDCPSRPVFQKDAPRKCVGCGVQFSRQRWCGDALKYCSRDCRFAHLRRQREDKIRARLDQRETCGRCLSPKNRPGRLCSKCLSTAEANRKALAREEYHRKNPPKQKACIECGSAFARIGLGNHKFCSLKCREVRRRSTRRIARLQRKALKRGASIGEYVNPFKVFTRDGWRCQLCQRRTPKRLRGCQQPLSPELDHIVPLSKGGEHSYRNVQLLCRQCNAAKRDSTIGQLRLVL